MNQHFQILLGKFTSYLEIKDFSPSTIRTYRRRSAAFLKWLDENEMKKISDVDRAVMESYQARLYRSKHLKSATHASKLFAVKSFFSFLRAVDKILYDPTGALVFPKKRATLPSVTLTETQAEKILIQPDLSRPLGRRDRAILETFYSTGLRNAELRSICLGDLDLEDGFLFVSEGKGRKDRVVPLGTIASQFIRLYLETARPHLIKLTRKRREKLFLTKSGNPMGENEINQMIKKYTKRAKVRKHVTAHVFRHTCATHMLKNDADIRYIQELLGHKQLSTTQRYTRVTITDLKNIHANHHPREKYKELFRGNENNSGKVKASKSEQSKR